MSLSIYVARDEAPVTLAEAKGFARIDISEDDTLVENLITAATTKAEDFNGRVFITSTWRLRLDAFPSDNGGLIELLPPVQTIKNITYIDTNGDSQTLAADQYTLDIYQEPGRLVPSYGNSWPATRDVMNAVTVEFVVGYGAAADVPEPKRLAILQTVVFWYERRATILTGTTMAKLPASAEALLWPDRITGWSGRYV